MLRRDFIRRSPGAVVASMVPDALVKLVTPDLLTSPVSLGISSRGVHATRRALKGTWTIERADDLTCLYGLNVEQELTDILKQEMADGIQKPSGIES